MKYLTFLFAISFCFAQNSTLKGRVSDGESNKSLSDAHIFILNTSSSTTTDNSGCFEFNNLNPGRVLICTYLFGYRDRIDTIIISKTDEEIEKDLKLFLDNEVEHARESDLVVFGEVMEVKDLPGPSSELFHSEALVRIDSTIKGKANFETLILLRQSGAISEFNSHVVSGEANFKVGERSIYFLCRPDKDNYLTSPFVQRGLYSVSQLKQNDKTNYKTSFYGKQSLGDLPYCFLFVILTCRK
jgi:hypothetical protein